MNSSAYLRILNLRENKGTPWTKLLPKTAKKRRLSSGPITLESRTMRSIKSYVAIEGGTLQELPHRGGSLLKDARPRVKSLSGHWGGGTAHAVKLHDAANPFSQIRHKLSLPFGHRGLIPLRCQNSLPFAKALSLAHVPFTEDHCTTNINFPPRRNTASQTTVSRV